MNFEKSEAMVKRHILAPATQLVNELCTNEKNMDDLYCITNKMDFETPAREAGFNVENHPDGYWLVWYEDGEKFVDGSYITALDAWETCCQDNLIEPYQDEAFEFYIVSDVLARRLKKRGELILNDYLGLTIWGRCATGSAVYTDDVMVDISKTTAI